MSGIVATLLGYLIGSVLPAYLIGRARGVELGRPGPGDFGVAHVWRALGLPAGVLSVTYDLVKGPLAMLVAWQVLEVSQPWVLVAGLATVLGDRFPFYLRFKGDRGDVAAAGLLFGSIGIAAARGWITTAEIAVFAITFCGLALVYRTPSVPVLVLIPVYVVALAWRSRLTPDPWFIAFVLVTGAFVWTTSLRMVRARQVFRLAPGTRAALRDVRVLLRPLALAFPVLYLFLSKPQMLALVGGVTGVFLLIDALRLLSKRVNVAVLRRASFFYRPNEVRTLSSATLFLVGSLITLFLFPKAVASTALVYVIIGDLMAKYAGLERGRVRVFSRTLEGSLMYFVSAVVAGFAWSHFVAITPPQYLLGALAAAVTEMLPWEINDNFAVPIISGAAMMAVSLV